MNTGSVRGRIYLEDGVADLACVSGLTRYSSRFDINKELQERAGTDLQGCSCSVGSCQQAHRGLAQGFAHEELHLSKSCWTLGLTNPRYVRVARTHSAVAAAVASGRADAGFWRKGGRKRGGPGLQVPGGR